MRPQDRMWDVGKSCIFSHSHQKWWNDVLVKTASHNLHVFCITTPLNSCPPLFSLALLATWYVLIHDHRDDKPDKYICICFFHHVLFSPLYSSSLSFVSLSFSPSYSLHKWMTKRLLSAVLFCLWMKRAVLIVFYVVWGTTLDLSLLSGFPPAGEKFFELVEEWNPGSQSHQLQLH